MMDAINTYIMGTRPGFRNKRTTMATVEPKTPKKSYIEGAFTTGSRVPPRNAQNIYASGRFDYNLHRCA